MFYTGKSKDQNLGKTTQRKSWEFCFKQIEKKFYFALFS